MAEPAAQNENMGHAMMQAFRALRADPGVQIHRPGSPARRKAIRRVLEGVGKDFGLNPDHIAIELAAAMNGGAQ